MTYHVSIVSLRGMVRRGGLFLLLAAVPVQPASAQRDSAAPAGEPAAAITAAELRATLEVIAHDSMRGRQLGSPALQHTAAYVAQRFAQLGLVPAGDPLNTVRALTGIQPPDSAAPWVQSFELPGNRTPSLGSWLTFSVNLQHGGRAVVADDGKAVQLRTEVTFGAGACGIGPRDSEGPPARRRGDHSPL